MVSILLWMLVFSLLHSVMADKRLKHFFQQHFGERAYQAFYRLFYNIIAFLSLAPLFWLLRGGELLYQVQGWLLPVFLLLQLLGAIGLLVSLIQIDWQRFVGIRQVLAYYRAEALPLPNEALVTSGVYALVRHPLYFFSLLFLWFSPMMTTHFLAFNLAATVYFLIGSIVEEGRMLEYYGETYQNYRQRVAWMLPFIHFPF